MRWIVLLLPGGGAETEELFGAVPVSCWDVTRVRRSASARVMVGAEAFEAVVLASAACAVGTRDASVEWLR